MVPAQAKFAATAGTHGLEPPLKPATAGARTPLYGARPVGGVSSPATDARYLDERGALSAMVRSLRGRVEKRSLVRS